jgi:hypothetical protein
MRNLLLIIFLLSVKIGIAQDTITLKNGEDIQAIIQEIGEVDVKYKKFDNPNGPNYTLKKSDIFMIKYANGSKDVFSNDETSVPIKSSSETAIKQDVPLELLSIEGIKISDSNGTLLTQQEVRYIMGNVPEALRLYDSGNNLRAAGWVFWGAEAGAYVVAIVKFYDGIIKDDENLLVSGVYWCLGSIALAIPAWTCWSAGNKKINNAVGVYNVGARQKYTSGMSLNFGGTRSGGIGFTINF